MFSFDTPRPARRMSLTPMVDVVFLLLVFFMLAAQSGPDRAIPLGAAAAGDGGAPYEGAPRLVGIEPDGLTLNGRRVAPGDLAAALAPLMPGPDALVVLRPAAGVDLGRAVAVADLLRASGFGRLVLAAPP